MIRARESSRRGVISIRARSDAMERERARERSRQLAQASKEINLFCRWVIDVVDPSGASLSIDRATIIATERSSLRLIPRNQCVKAYFLIPSRRGLPCLSCILSLSLSLSLPKANRYYSASGRRCTPLSAAGCLHERLSTGNAYEAVLRVLLERIGDWRRLKISGAA